MTFRSHAHLMFAFVLVIIASPPAAVRSQTATPQQPLNPVVTAPTARADTAQTKRSLLAADKALAAAARIRGGGVYLDAAAKSAVILFPGQPILEAQNARRAFLNRYGTRGVYGWHPAAALASTDGRFGCTVGFSTYNVRGRIGNQFPGHYITCWQRTLGGRWRIVGHQRDDSLSEKPRGFDRRVFSRAPRSAIIAVDGNAQIQAAETDEEFARYAERPEGPGPAFARYASDDAILMSPAYPRGPRELLSVFNGFPSSRILLWNPSRTYGAGRGGLAFSVGHSVSRERGENPGRQNYSKYLTVWRQKADGRWEWVLDLGSSRPAGEI